MPYVPSGTPQRKDKAQARTGIQRSATIEPEILQKDPCLDGLCGTWEFDTLGDDIKEQRALGIEIRLTTVTAALVDIDGGQLLSDPVKIEVKLMNLTNEEAISVELAKAIMSTTKHLNYNGVVGCSVTRSVLRTLGVESNDTSFVAVTEKVGRVLKAAKVKSTFTHVMLQSEAAGYSELSASKDSEDSGAWRRLVTVVAVGERVETVLFRDGHRLRRSGICTMIESPWVLRTSRLIPQADEPGWADYMLKLDGYLQTVVNFVGPDHIILVPTGNLAFRPDIQEALASHMERATEDLAKSESAHPYTVKVTTSPEYGILRGSAMAALVEFRSVTARMEVRKALEGTQSLSVLSMAKQRAVFDAFDLDASGELDPWELQAGLESLGISRDISEVFEDDSEEAAENEAAGDGLESSKKGMGPVTFELFQGWWAKCINNAAVISIDSQEELDGLVIKPEEPDRFGPLLVLEVTFSFCRICRGFTRKYETLARQNQDVRFVSVQGNFNRETMKLAARLNVTKAPAFFVYNREADEAEPLLSWTGGNLTRCKLMIEEAKSAVGVLA